jgi:hypothetical protein
MNSTAPKSQFRSRLTLLLIAAMFFGSFGIAAFLRFSGWTPGQGRNLGELLQPPRDFSSTHFQRADGKPTDACAKTLDALHRIWLIQGRKADHIDVLWFGALPAGGPRFRRLVAMQADAALDAALPEKAGAETVPVYLIDPSGFLVMHYRAGFDPGDLKKDLGKLLK